MASKNSKLIEAVRSFAQERYSNHEFNWEHHIVPVVKYSLILAKRCKADEEIVEIAALLHDITRIEGDKGTHHITGQAVTEELLKKLGYPQQKIDHVKQCIFTHRGAYLMDKGSPEAECVASADAMAHFDGTFLLFYHYMKKIGSVDAAKDKVLKKLERSWAKMMPEARKLVKNKYDSARLLLEAL